MVLLVYVDDIVTTGSDSQLIDEVQQNLETSFHVKDLSPLQYFLGLEVDSTHQHSYTEDIIASARLESGNSILTPMEVNLKLRQTERDLLAGPLLYR